ncbi:hypothetical protein HYV88_00980 [Candidatus Woesearchaeota archaeon]|nr:hypothetical protein [Candidatus Woesearchaeota archaeon]
MNNENLFYIFLLIIAVVLLIYGVWYTTTYRGTSYQNALNVENKEDICATPEGYTDQEWREHMGHHPDRYKDCLGG